MMHCYNLTFMIKFQIIIKCYEEILMSKIKDSSIRNINSETGINNRNLSNVER